MFADDKLELARAQNDLIRSCLESDQIEEAIPLIEKELTLLKQSIGDNSLELAEAYDRLCDAQAREHAYAKAIEAECNALEIRKQAFGDKHVDVACSLRRISRYHQENGNDELAYLYKKREVSVLKSLLGTQHPEYTRAKEDQSQMEKRREKASATVKSSK